MTLSVGLNRNCDGNGILAYVGGYYLWGIGRAMKVVIRQIMPSYIHLQNSHSTLRTPVASLPHDLGLSAN